jgi:hypothetical protein
MPKIIKKKANQKPAPKTNAQKLTKDKPTKNQPITKLKRKLDKTIDKAIETNVNILRLVSDNSKPKEKIIIKKLNRKSNQLINQSKNTIEKDKTKGKDEPISEELVKEIEYRDREVARLFASARKRKGRPTKLTEQLIVDMEVLARIGLSESAIANSVKVNESTLIKWKEKNKDFSNRLKTARENGKSVLVNSILGHGLKSWQATAWILERMHREQFALNQKVEVTGASGGPITFNVKYEDKKEPEASTKSKKEAEK